MRNRRPIVMLLLVVVAASSVAVVVVAAGRGAGDSPGAGLAERMADPGDEAPFSFSVARGGTRVLDCVSPNRRYTGVVDPAAQRALLSLPDEVAPVVVMDGATLLLHRSLFADPPFATAWMELRRPIDGQAADALARSLGADLAAEVGAVAVPQSGRAVVRAALEVANAVNSLAPAVVDGRPADVYQIAVDPAQFAEAVSLPSVDSADPTTTSAGSDVVPVIEVWVDERDDVVRLTVRPQRWDGTLGAPADGWTVYYREAAAVVLPPVGSDDVTVGDDVNLSRLSAAARDCSLPS